MELSNSGVICMRTSNVLENAVITRDNGAVTDLFYKQGLISAYHDRSDGGVITTLLEMAFASHRGLDIVNDDISALFNEELGCVIQVSNAHMASKPALSKAAAISI
jgi:phosphoribosylformylglycinamidine synthase